MTPSRVPAIPLEVVEYLERRHPNRAPDINDSERAVWFKAGQADVATALRNLYNSQNKRKPEG